MKQLTIFHFFDFKQDQLYLTLQNLKENETKKFAIGEVVKNSIGLFEFRSEQEERVFSKVLDCYIYVLEGESDIGLH